MSDDRSRYGDARMPVMWIEFTIAACTNPVVIEEMVRMMKNNPAYSTKECHQVERYAKERMEQLQGVTDAD